MDSRVGPLRNDCSEYEAGPIGPDRYYALCYTPAQGTKVSLVRLDGEVISTTDLAYDINAFGASRTTRTADALLIWNAVQSRMTRFDFATGVITTGEGMAATDPAGR